MTVNTFKLVEVIVDPIESLGREEDLSAVKEACRSLLGRFDNVQIFASRHVEDEGGAANVNFGMGNFFARYGQVKLWCVREEGCTD